MSSFYNIYCVHPIGVASYKSILKNQRVTRASFSRPSIRESAEDSHAKVFCGNKTQNAFPIHSKAFRVPYCRPSKGALV